FSNPTNKVSAHYTIDRDGSITAHVPELRRAWHAGQSKMRDGRTNVNDFSIGIELVNQNDGLDPFPEQQIAGMRALLRSIRCRHPIKHIIPHYACAEPPGRCASPWRSLAFRCKASVGPSRTTHGRHEWEPSKRLSREQPGTTAQGSTANSF